MGNIIAQCQAAYCDSLRHSCDLGTWLIKMNSKKRDLCIPTLILHKLSVM